jgi:hypothetical protein
MRKMKNYLLFKTLLILISTNLFGQTTTLSNETFNTSQIIQGIDTLVVSNCTFENISGVALRITDVKYVSLNGNLFRNVNTGSASEAAVTGRRIDYFQSQENHFFEITGNAYRFPYQGAVTTADRLGTIKIESDTIINIKSLSTNQGNGIYVFHTDSLYIENNYIKNVDHNGIAVGSPNNIPLEKVDFCNIKNNVIDSILGNGILGAEMISNAFVYDNTISNIATDGIGALPSNGDHGIYWQAPDAIISGNIIDNNLDGTVGCSNGCRGIGISIRTNAKVLANTVSNCEGGGIVYWGDHPANGTLTIANNIIYDNTHNGILINGSYNGETYPDSIFVYHNTVLNINPNTTPYHFYSPLSLYDYYSGPIDPQVFNPYAEAVGNLLIFEGMTDTTKYVFESNVTFDKKAFNFLIDGDPSMVDYNNRDLRVLSNSAAVDFLPIFEQNVSVDFFGTPRVVPFDAGAHEFSPLTSITDFSEASNAIKLFPNPFKNVFNIESKEDISSVKVYNIKGQIIYSLNGIQNKELHLEINLDVGLYLVSIQLWNGNVVTLLVVKS